MIKIVNNFVLPAAVVGGLLSGCARVSVEGGEKPIHIVLDINIRVDQALDRFFAFEEQAAPAPPATPTSSMPTSTAPATQPAAGRSIERFQNESGGES